MTRVPSNVLMITITTKHQFDPTKKCLGILVWTYSVIPPCQVRFREVQAPRLGLPPLIRTAKDRQAGAWPPWLPQPDLQPVRRAARIILGDDVALDVARVVLATDPHDPVAELQAFREIRDLVTRIEDCRLCGAAGWLDARNKPNSRQLNEVECPDCHGVGKRRVAS